jgi:magnesium chelatase subunit D
VFDIAGNFTSHLHPPQLTSADLPGKWQSRANGRRGPMVDIGGQLTNGVAWAATLRRAALRKSECGELVGPIILRPDDLRFWRRHERAGRLLLFVVDASGSMGAWRRMRQTKAAILALLVQAYQHRDRIALLAFRGAGAELVLPPMTSLERARHALERLPVGGATPLAHGLDAARRLIRAQQRRTHRLSVWTVILTDGRTNVSIVTSQAESPGDRPWLDAVQQAGLLRAMKTDVLVVDTETGWPRFGRAGLLASALNAQCCALEEVIDRRAVGFSPVVKAGSEIAS